MVHVIVIAAGKATRMAPHSFITPKSLMELESGLPVIKFVIRQLRKIGLGDITIVIRMDASRFFDNLDGEVKLVKLDSEEEFGNLYSAFMGGKTVNGSFLLVMSDHIFELEMLRRVVEKAEKTDKAFVLCLDREPSRKAAEEGLKIFLDGERIVKTDKDLLPVYGIDTGLIYCGERAISYFENAVKKFGKNCSIKDALNLAVENNDVEFVDVTGLLWQDIDTLEDLEKAREIYWEIIRRDITKANDGIVSRYINRQISTRLSIALYRAGIFINPDLISIFGFLIAILGSLFIMLGHLVIGGLVIQLSSIVDGIDGEVARLFDKQSIRGEVFDLLLDRVADVFIVMGIAISVWPLGITEMVLSILAAANVILVNYATQILKTSKIDINALRRIPATRDVRLFIIAICSIAGYPFFSIYYIAFAPLIYIIAGCGLLLLTSKERRALFHIKRTWKIWPYIPPGAGIRIATNNIFQNGLRLLFTFLVTRLLLPPFSDIIIIQRPIELSVALLIPIIEAVSIVYFGSKILIATGVIVEFISFRLVEKLRITTYLIRSIIKDLSYLIFAAVFWCYSWYFLDLPVIGPYIIKLTVPLISIIIIYMVYRITSRIYNTYREVIEEKARRIEDTAHT